MTELYSIGDTAAINGISVKTLRFYDEIGLIKPRYTDPKTGYRYYTYDQFPYIDKIKRYKNMGIPLKDLKAVLESGDLDNLRSYLEDRKLELEEETRKLLQMKGDIEWLTEYLEYSRKLDIRDHVFMKEAGEQCLIAAPCEDCESIYEMDMELRRIVGAPPFRDLAALNPYGYILDYDALMDNRVKPLYATVSLREKPEFDSPYLFTAPAGTYICCQAKILSPNWSVAPLQAFFASMQRPRLVLAYEHLSSLYDYQNSTYEVQALL